MPTAIYDSSYLTFRKRAATLYSYNNSLVTARESSNIVRTEQPTLQTGEVITTRKQGGCIHPDDSSAVNFGRSTSGPCGCAR